jgi:hypothetical protein
LGPGIRIINRGRWGSRFRRIRRLLDYRLFYRRFGFGFGFRFGLRLRLHRRRFLGRRLFLGGFRRRFFRRGLGFRFGLRLRRGCRGRTRLSTPGVYDLKDYRGPASGGKAQGFRRALGKIHDTAFSGRYTPCNGYGNLLIISGVYNLYLSPQRQARVACC